MARSAQEEHGPFPTSMVQANTLDEAGWAVRTLADSASKVGRGPLARAIAACIVALFALPVLQALQIDLGALPAIVLGTVLLGLVAAFVLQAGQGAEPVFQRLRLDRRRLLVDEVRGDWTLHEDEVLTAEGSRVRELPYDEIAGVSYAQETITIDCRDGEPWRLDWLPPMMAEEVVAHLQRTLSDRGDPAVAAERQAALQRLVSQRDSEGSGGL